MLTLFFLKYFRTVFIIIKYASPRKKPELPPKKAYTLENKRYSALQH
jgi:hypothetical protein